MAKEFKISTLRLKELEQELFYLKTTREKEVAEQIKEARSFGDLSENSDMETEEEEVYAIVGSQEANPMECRISDDSPFGRALLGHSVGEIVEVEAPIGTLRYKILSVER